VAAPFRQTRLRRLANFLITPLVRLGLTGKRTHILTVPGRRTGRSYSTPVQLVIESGRRWLVAPYGDREWVKNARAAGEVELTRAGRTERYRVEEVSSEVAAPILREYLRTTPVVKRFFDVSAAAPIEEIAAEAARHPVFRLLEAEPRS
jgi:deazaflavin-dependent oxidoreductase (nitroreductase family)